MYTGHLHVFIVAFSKLKLIFYESAYICIVMVSKELFSVLKLQMILCQHLLPASGGDCFGFYRRSIIAAIQDWPVVTSLFAN